MIVLYRYKNDFVVLKTTFCLLAEEIRFYSEYIRKLI